MKQPILLFLVCYLLTSQSFLFGQDSITIQDLKKFTYTFSIEDGKFTGEGGEILKKAIAESHITMLGENVGSKLEHQFTNALIDELDQHNYKKMVLDIGDGSGAVINKMSKNSTLTEQNVKRLNQQYLLEKKGRTFVPILDLKSVEGIKSIENANNRGWTFLSIGIEPWTSYKMLVDELYSYLLPENKKTYQKLYKETLAVIEAGYETIQAHNKEEVFKLIALFKASEPFNEFLEKMRICERNRATIESIQQSIDYYWMYGNGKNYEKNHWHGQLGKEKLKEGLENINFDFQEDKLFVKMWQFYLAKGYAIRTEYGVGNLLMEMASYHGNKSLSIGVLRRFFKDGSEVKDFLQANNVFTKNHRELIQLGKENDWILVDLRPFMKEFYYGNYIQSDGLYKMFTRYDMMVIPKTDESSKSNF